MSNLIGQLLPGNEWTVLSNSHLIVYYVRCFSMTGVCISVHETQTIQQLILQSIICI